VPRFFKQTDTVRVLGTNLVLDKLTRHSTPEMVGAPHPSPAAPSFHSHPKFLLNPIERWFKNLTDKRQSMRSKIPSRIRQGARRNLLRTNMPRQPTKFRRGWTNLGEIR
jgi:hypothetical protein